MTQVARSSRTINWYRTPIGREQQRELNQASDVKAGLQIGGHLSLLALTASVAWSVQPSGSSTQVSGRAMGKGMT